MIVRILAGNNWSAAQPAGDYDFDILPQIGHKIVLAEHTGWAAAQVSDIVHRLSNPDGPADVALLVTPLASSNDRSELPTALLDSIGRGAPVTSVPKAGPWS